MELNCVKCGAILEPEDLYADMGDNPEDREFCPHCGSSQIEDEWGNDFDAAEYWRKNE